MSEMYFTENGWRALAPDENGLMSVYHHTGAEAFFTEEDLTAMLAMYDDDKEEVV